MILPYFLGCPQWQDPGWNSLLPPGPAPLARYSQVLNCVEGNTTFYATPSQEQCRQWRSQVSEDFRFLFKLPRRITHDQLLSGVTADTRAFLDVLSPLNDVLGPLFVQLPAAFRPEHLDRLWQFLDKLPERLTYTVEVRNSAFFSKGEAEKRLNRGLRERNTSRVCLDSRALFSAQPNTEIIREAQRKKPKLPVHILPVDAPPMIRYIGHPQLDCNPPFLAPWVERVSQWIEQGQQPYVFMHMPDNGDALALAQLWSKLLHERLPQIAALDLAAQRPQLGLF